MRKVITNDGSNCPVESTDYKATIFDGHSHIERRVFVDAMGVMYVRINGFFAGIDSLRRVNRFSVDVWYDPESIKWGRE